jgi:hypothetical protein
MVTITLPPMAIRAETPYLLRMTSKTNSVAILVEFCLEVWSKLLTFEIILSGRPLLHLRRIAWLETDDNEGGN